MNIYGKYDERLSLAKTDVFYRNTPWTCVMSCTDFNSAATNTWMCKERQHGRCTYAFSNCFVFALNREKQSLAMKTGYNQGDPTSPAWHGSKWP